MPDSFGKRQRDQVKARKAAARDERRVARSKRKKEGTPSVSESGRFDAAWHEPGSAASDRGVDSSGRPVDG
jgi:hypothetical protein